MKKNLFHLPALLLTLAAATPAIAQTADDSADDDVIFTAGAFEITGTNNEIGEILDRVRPVEPNSIPRPKFAIRTPDNSFILSIGGKINPIIGYDLGNDLYNAPGGGIDFVTGSIPVPAQSGHRSAFFINPLNAYLDFTVVGLAGTDNEVTGYVKLATNHDTKGVILKRAYVTWRGITAGVTATNFQDGLAAQPATIDPNGPCGDISGTTYSIFYNSRSYNGFAFGAGIEMPTFYSSNGVYRGKDYRHDFYGVSVTSEASQKAPDIPAYIEYAASKQNRVRLSGIFRNFFYRDLISDKTRHEAGWGVQLSGNFSFYRPLTFNFQGVYGKGLGCYIQDLSGRALSFTPKDSKVGEMTANPMMGLVFGASYDVTSKLQFNAVGSYARIWDVEPYATANDADGVASADNYRCAIYAGANCFYKITPYLQVGLEYLYGRHYTWDLGGANDSRIQAQFSFAF